MASCNSHHTELTIIIQVRKFFRHLRKCVSQVVSDINIFTFIKQVTVQHTHDMRFIITVSTLHHQNLQHEVNMPKDHWAVQLSVQTAQNTRNLITPANTENTGWLTNKLNIKQCKPGMFGPAHVQLVQFCLSRSTVCCNNLKYFPIFFSKTYSIHSNNLNAMIVKTFIFINFPFYIILH